MSNEEFQKLVLESLDTIKADIKDIKNTLKATHEQTTLLTEQMTELKEDMSKMDILTAKNNLDIAKLKAVK